MEYPSLIFREGPSGRVIDRDVFDDLKLNLLIGEGAIDAMSRLCEPEDIPLRQELFETMRERSVRNAYAGLAHEAGQVKRLFSALSAIRCDNERHFIYCAMVLHMLRFFRGAENAGGKGFFAERFTEFFRKSNAELKDMADACFALEDSLDRVRVCGYRERGEELWIRREDEETIVSRLKKCADDLGLTDTRASREVELHINPRIINAMAVLYRDEFVAFKSFYDSYSSFFTESFLDYCSELGFYLEVSRLLDTVRAQGMPVCVPAVASKKKAVVHGVRDISLMAKQARDIVPNDAEFTRSEPFFYLTGANGGGKTTYLRAVGIAMTLFLAGCPICADSAEIWPMEGVFTHFPRDERFDSEGRFADEQRRIKQIMEKHNGGSMILLNETYSTTSEEIAVDLTSKLAEQLFDSGSFGIYITHQHGIGETRIPFLSVIVDESDANRRTYRIARRRAATGSFAEDILKKYGMTEEALNRRFPPEGGEPK